jgi:hypothetical protein
MPADSLGEVTKDLPAASQTDVPEDVSTDSSPTNLLEVGYIKVLSLEMSH